MLNLRNIVKTMPLLFRALGSCRSQLLGIIAEVGYMHISFVALNSITQLDGLGRTAC